MESATLKALDAITDEGLFERIATAVLRMAPSYSGLIHTGINADGKTRKAPVDGIAFVGAKCEHMVLANHTITAASGLERKWLHDPSRVERRSSTRSLAAPPGDLIKSLELIRDERSRNPDLIATVVLMTNREPSIELVSNVVARARLQTSKSTSGAGHVSLLRSILTDSVSISGTSC